MSRMELVGGRKVGTALKGQHEESLCDAIVLNFDCINADIVVVILYCSFEKDVIMGGNWVKLTGDLPVLFLTTNCL